LKKNQKKPERFRNRTLRVNHHLKIDTRKCPSCGTANRLRCVKGKDAGGYSSRHKRAFDLLFTPSGIKRRVIECETSVYRCLECGQIFIPERYQRLAKHFHGLVSWAVYNQVAHRVSCSNLSEMIKDFFDLAVCKQELYRFKAMAARYYRTCYKKLIDKIVSSKILHADETEIKLRSGKGYVWVFATFEEVVYIYRPSREGNFLFDLLRNFDGVIITDFYAAYDSLECPQQKCLIHLLRDMNQELLANPYDQELQSITASFGILLRNIVATIDTCGLKRFYLRKHEQEASKFLESLETGIFRSEIAEDLRRRLLKYKDKLFTFVRYDSVPWNNNNAENAIRQFAYYREDTTRSLTETGLIDHLVLLSISQTCRYKGISFLNFLLSKKQDIDAFNSGRYPRKRSSVIEIYPKGIMRPDFRPAEPATRKKTHI